MKVSEIEGFENSRSCFFAYYFSNNRQISLKKITLSKSACKHWLIFLHGAINQAFNFTAEKKTVAAGRSPEDDCAAIMVISYRSPDGPGDCADRRCREVFSCAEPQF
jgi:hypothetical protein